MTQLDMKALWHKIRFYLWDRPRFRWRYQMNWNRRYAAEAAAIGHDWTMPHDMRYATDDPQNTAGCPPNCPARLRLCPDCDGQGLMSSQAACRTCGGRGMLRPADHRDDEFWDW